MQIQVSSEQLRDDLLSMLVAGHETTGSVLSWTAYLLSKNPSSLKKGQEEVDKVLQGRRPTFEDIKNLKFITRCINESMRLYPHPPILIRRAKIADELPGNYKVNPGEDIMIYVYNIHHSSKVWERAEEFIPERFDLDGPVPNESNTDYKFIPFSGGPRKFVGDQFAMLEAILALVIFLQEMEFELVPNLEIKMTTGATIHTTNGLYMKVKERKVSSVLSAASLPENPLPPYFDCGDASSCCCYCGALLWYEERVLCSSRLGNPSYNQHCRAGTVVLPPSVMPPTELLRLYEDSANTYNQHIRTYFVKNVNTMSLSNSCITPGLPS